MAVAVATLVVLLYGRVGFVPSPVSAPEATPNDQTKADIGEEFREKMNLYENEIKPEILSLNLPAWAPEEHAALTDKELSAVEDFTNGNFTSGIKKFDELITQVAELKDLWEKNFNSAFAEAQQAFTSFRVSAATDAINRALLYKSDDSGTISLKNRITVMEKVVALVKAADVAQIENKLDEEIALLAKAIDLDPKHTALTQRHRLLKKQKDERDFDDLIKKAWLALDQKNISRSRANLSQAAQIFPQRKELTLLTKELKKNEKNLAYKKFVRQAQAATQDDDWQNVEAHYTKALGIFPGDEKTRAELERARAINRHTQQLEKALAHPERLSDTNVAVVANELLIQNEQLASHSPTLQRLTEQLSHALRQASIPVPVVVHSDKKTYVSVLGIGMIGKVRKYSLKEGLKPGSYTFKGNRKGYKDKLITVRIRQGQAVNVTVICDEPV